MAIKSTINKKTGVSRHSTRKQRTKKLKTAMRRKGRGGAGG